METVIHCGRPSIHFVTWLAAKSTYDVATKIGLGKDEQKIPSGGPI